MTAPELKEWLTGDLSKQAGQTNDSGDVETVGHESGRKILEILEKNPSGEAGNYDEDDLVHTYEESSGIL